MAGTSIEWATDVWNPLSGCTRVSEGCTHCYAERIAHRFRDMGDSHPLHGLTTVSGRWNGTVRTHERKLADPLRWRKPRRIFVNSMSDLFHEGVPDYFIDQVFAVMALARQHTFQLLTKRAERMLEYLSSPGRRSEIAEDIAGDSERRYSLGQDPDQPVRFPWPLLNVWLGVSVEDQKTADERIPLLLRTPAAVHIVSYEPALGPVDFEGYLGALPEDEDGAPYPGRLDQIIVGGESGPGARQCAGEWIRSTVYQCKNAGVACFVKQLGAEFASARDNLAGAGPRSYASGIEVGYKPRRLRDRKGGDMAEWPEDLRVREFPRGAQS